MPSCVLRYCSNNSRNISKSQGVTFHQYCQNCKAPCAGDFRKVVDLQYSGLLIYVHTKKDNQKKADYSKYEDTFILHNIGSKQIKKSEYHRELHRFKTKCAQCKLIVEKVRSLLDEIRTIKENEVIGVCENCKRATSHNKKCKRCDIIVSEFISTHEKTRQRQQYFKVWLCKVNHLLQAIVDGESVCQHRVYRDTELERILHALKEHLTMRELDIDFFPNLDLEEVMPLQSMSENKETLEELLSKLEFVRENRDSSSESLYPSPSEEMCLCKYLKEKVEGGIAGLGVISDASKAVGLGLNNNQNKKMVHVPVNNLNKALTSSTEEVQRLSIGFKNALPKGVSKGLCSRYSNGKKSFKVAGTGEAIDTCLSNSQTGIAKKFTKPRKSTSDKPLQLQQQTSEKRCKKDSSSAKTSILVSRTVSKVIRSRYFNGTTSFEVTEHGEVIDRSLCDSEESIAKKVSKPGKSASKKHLQLQQQTSEKESKKDALLDKDKVKGGISGIGSRKFKDSLLTREQLNDFSRPLSAEGNESLIKRLLDLSKALPQELYLNKELTQDIIETIDAAIKKNLPKNIVIKLINELTELNRTVTQDLSKSLNRKITQELLNDLNDLLTIGSPKDLNHDLIKLLVDLSEFLTRELSNGLNKEHKSIDSTNALVQKLAKMNRALVAGVSDKNLVQKLSCDINKAIGRMPLNELIKTIKEFTDLCKLAVQGIPKTANLKLVQGLISDASKALCLGLSKDQNKKMIHVLVNNLYKALICSTDKVQRVSIGLKKAIPKEVSKVLRSRYSKEKTSPEIVGNSEVRGKSSADSQTGIAKKVTKPRKNASEKPLQLQQQTSEKQSKKDSLSYKTSRKESGSERAATINLKKEEKHTKVVKGKENLSPEGEKKKKYLKSQSKQSTPPLTDAKELSEILLHKNQIKEENFKLNKQRQLDELTEKERIRLKKQTVKNVTKMKKLKPLPSSRDEVTELMIFGDTTPFSSKAIEKKTIEPLLSKTPLQSADNSIARRSFNYQTLFDGAVKYQLSNEEFIRNGWTILPTEKTMRRMNIYRMVPANSQNCWFEQHQQDGELFYDSGQKLADIDHNGRGHWYYRNGTVALDYYDAQESNIGQRYVVYSSGTEMESGKIRPRTILALFDVLGHGVIYDLHGNVRLKYNQSEGVVVDPKIGPQSKWKWHTLNDPPILQRVFINKCLEERDPKLERVKKSTISTTEVARPANSEMIVIELDNLMKEKRFKLKQKFRPFQIRIKTVKLNEQFSLKILDQATITLLYGDGVTRLKLNLGMLLKSDEIIDTVTSDVGDVFTPYDIRPANTESVENIQKILKTVRSGKVHTVGAYE